MKKLTADDAVATALDYSHPEENKIFSDGNHLLVRTIKANANL